MKQLEPILKHHFWILLGVALLLALAGWWMTTGEMQAAIDTRKKAIDEADKKWKVGDVPGTDWEVKLKAINEQQERLVKETRYGLYARQKERMIWPAVIREFASRLKYREEFTDVIHHINYRDNYSKEVERVYSIPRPITPTNKNGVVLFPLSVMPHRVWGNHTPTSKQMWDSIEDLWLLEPILQAVLEVNGGVEASPLDASVLVIEQLKLYGGDRSKIGQTAQSSGGEGAGGMGAGMPTGGFGGGGGGKDSAGGSGGSLAFNPIEVFGDPGASTDDGGGGGVAAMPAGGGMPPMGEGIADQKPSGEETGRRYIDDDPGMPYRTRGFILTVVMDHRKVPDLYAQLTSSERSPWPIQIVRMHVGRLSDASGIRGGQGAMAGGFGEPAGGLIGPGGPASPAAGVLEANPIGAFRPQTGGVRDPGVDENFNKPMNDMMSNPFLAVVSVAGMITLYNEPEMKDAPANPGTPAEAAPTAAAAEGVPAAETASDDAEADPAMSDDDPSAAPEQASDLDVTEEEMLDDEEKSQEKPEAEAAPESEESDSSEEPEDVSEEPASKSKN